MINANQALDLLNALSEGGSDGGEVSGLSDVSRIDSASDWWSSPDCIAEQSGDGPTTTLAQGQHA